MIRAAEHKERRVGYDGMRALLTAVLGHEEGAHKAFSEFRRSLFPEEAFREQALDARNREILAKMDQGPIPVEPAVSVGSAWGNAVRGNDHFKTTDGSPLELAETGPSQWGLRTRQRKMTIGRGPPPRKPGEPSA